MSGNSAWFIITSEEIEAIRHGLRGVRSDIPDNNAPVREIQEIIDTVQDRLA